MSSRRTISILACLSLASVSVLAGPSLLDDAGRLLSVPSSASTADGVVAVVSSPGTPSQLLSTDPSNVLELMKESPSTLVCRGATLSGMSPEDRTSISVCSLLADCIVIDGVTGGDIESGFRTSRHARTLTGLFRARLRAGDSEESDRKSVV